MTLHRTSSVLAVAGLTALALAGCVAKSDAAASGALRVESTDGTCAVSAPLVYMPAA